MNRATAAEKGDFSSHFIDFYSADEAEVESTEGETEMGATYHVSSDVHYTNNKMNR